MVMQASVVPNYARVSRKGGTETSVPDSTYTNITFSTVVEDDFGLSAGDDIFVNVPSWALWVRHSAIISINDIGHKTGTRLIRRGNNLGGGFTTAHNPLSGAEPTVLIYRSPWANVPPTHTKQSIQIYHTAGLTLSTTGGGSNIMTIEFSDSAAI